MSFTLISSGMSGVYTSLFTNKNTQSSYKLSMLRFHKFLDEHNITDYNQVNLEVAQSFKAYLESIKSPKTCNMTIATIKEFYQWLKVKSDNLNNQLQSEGKHPCHWVNLEIMELTNTKVCSREQHTACLTEREVNRLMKAAYNYPDPFQCAQFKIMLLVMLNAGLRVQELTQLKPDNFTFTPTGQYMIKVTGKGMRKRIITLSRAVTNELKVIFDQVNYGPDQYLIQGQDNGGNADPTKPITSANIWKRIKRLTIQAGIDKDISPHSLRRTCATLMYKKGVPLESIQRILGHDNPHTTQRYIDMEIDIEVSAKYALSLTGDAV